MERESIESEHCISSDVKLTHWGNGPWVEELDFVKWKYKGIVCLVKRAYVVEGFHLGHLSLGNLNGYIQVPKEHPWFKKDYNDIDVEVHGGLTFGEIRDEGEFWIGFDCAHSFDIVPSIEPTRTETDKEICKKHGISPSSNLLMRSYKDINFVKAECESMVDQLLQQKSI